MVLWDPALVESSLADFDGGRLDFGGGSTDALWLGEHWDNPGLVGEVAAAGNDSGDDKVQEETVIRCSSVIAFF